MWSGAYVRLWHTYRERDGGEEHRGPSGRMGERCSFGAPLAYPGREGDAGEEVVGAGKGREGCGGEGKGCWLLDMGIASSCLLWMCGPVQPAL